MTVSFRAQHIFKPQFRFGLGGVPLGNEFEVVTDEDADATLQASWEAGVRYFDVSPWYGLGLSERRFGRFLHRQPRDSYLLFPYASSPNNLVFDYTADGVKRSIEDSLQRLGLDRIDVVFVHDLSPDNVLLPRPWTEEFEIALKGAFPALSKMRGEGVIGGWGVGVNSPEPILRVIRESDPDVCLLARQYSLIDHEYALENVFPVAREHGVPLLVDATVTTPALGRALEAGADLVMHSATKFLSGHGVVLGMHRDAP